MRVDWRVALAIGAVWIVWGSTYAGMHLAVATIPPFVMSALRFLLAGTILFAICAARGGARVTRSDLVHGTVSGAALLLFGNGMTAWTVQFLPTGVNALLLSCAPIWMAVIAFVWGRERPTRAAIVGMVLGLAGLALLVRSPSGDAIPLGPAIVSVLASVSWAVGSIYSRRMSKTANIVLATALQMLAGGALLALEAGLTGQWRSFDVHAVSVSSWLGFGWLVVFGSIVGYSAYLYTMQTATTALASTYAYVNPLVSVGLGYVLFGERLSPGQGLASVIIVAGVALMMVPRRSSVAVVRAAKVATLHRG